MTAFGWWRVVVLGFGVLFLAACTESANLFSTLDDQAEPELSIIPAGSIIRADQRLDVQIRYPSQDSSRATRMRVELQDPSGRVHGSVEFDRAELGEPLIRTFAFTDAQDNGSEFWDVDSGSTEDDDHFWDDDTEQNDAERFDDPAESSEDEAQVDTATPVEDEAPGESDTPMEGEAQVDTATPVADADDDSLQDDTGQLDENGEAPEENSQATDEDPQTEAEERLSQDDETQRPEEEVQPAEDETGSGNEERRPRRDPTQPQDGVYTLVTEAWINDQSLLTDRRQIFVVSNPPSIESITIHPSTIRREMQALAVAEIDYSETTRPYLRWLFDGEVAAEGYLEDGFDRAILDGVGRSVGAYQVMLEVYPWGVDEGVEIDGNTMITAKSDVVVRAELLPEPPDFLQQFEGDAVRYFSFDGTRQAWTGDSSDKVEATIAGDVYLDMVSGALGVRVEQDGEILAPLPVPDSPNSVHIVALRISSTGAATSFHDEPVISFGAAHRSTTGMPIVIEDGMLIASPSTEAPIPMGRVPDQYELRTFRFILHNRDGSTLLEPLLDDGPSGRMIDLGTGAESVSVEVHGGSDLEMFVDRITVTSQTKNDLRAHFVSRATVRLLESMKNGVRQWALSVPSDWPESPTRLGDYPAPSESIVVDIDNSPVVNVVLPDRGGLSLIAEDADGSERHMTLHRQGNILELTDEQAEDGRLARVRIPGIPNLLSSFRIQVMRSVATESSERTAELRNHQDEQGTLITLNLPEAVAPAELSILPEAFDAHLPAWVGRWIR